MALHLADKYIWDFWFARSGADYHVFYLQAPRSLPNPELRHWNVSLGHAVSQDLRTWHILPDALRPGPLGTWDDYTTWTGSVMHHGSEWHLFYTGTHRAENGLVQRIGLATSTDLIRWEKYPDNPILVADPQWYELLDLALWHDQAWRDPWVFQHPTLGDFHALITARVNYGSPDGRGVIAHARSDDLRHWEVLPPITEPDEFGQLEVPQLSYLAGHYYLLFSTSTHHQSAARRQRVGSPVMTGTHYLMADQPLGPYRWVSDEFLVGDRNGSLYSGKLTERAPGEWVFIAARFSDSNGMFLGELTDPYPVNVDDSGRLEVQL
jgi:beta-fructofuranosidase